MGSKGSRRGPLKTLPIKSYSVQEMAHSSGFGAAGRPQGSAGGMFGEADVVGARA